MLAAIFIGYFIGNYFDGDAETAYWAGIGAFLGIVFALSYVIVTLLREK